MNGEIPAVHDREWAYREHDAGHEVTVIGYGEIGDKARELIDKTPILRAIGFQTPPRFVLAEGFFDDFFQTNNLAGNLQDVQIKPENIETIVNGQFTLLQQQKIRHILNRFGDTPVVVRSSACKDARGTGTYKSEFVSNNIHAVEHAIKNVLASYFSESAVAFRQKTNAQAGFGILLEPLIGQSNVTEYTSTAVAPHISGFGYTTTASGEGFTTIVPGLGSAVEARDGERITEKALQETQGNLNDYFLNEQSAIGYNHKANRPSPFLWGPERGKGLVFIDGRIRRKTMALPWQVLSADMRPLFSMMTQLEEAFKKPQYIEWALTSHRHTHTYWITQIADVEPHLDTIEFGEHTNYIFICRCATNSGKCEATKIVMCTSPQDIHHLHTFNQKNQGYILVYSANLAKPIIDSSSQSKTLQFADFSNAGVCIEKPTQSHVRGGPASHLGTQAVEAGMLIGAINYDAHTPDWDTIETNATKEDGLTVLSGRFIVESKASHNKLIVAHI